VSAQGAKHVTIDPEAWARNLRVARDAPLEKDADTRWLNNYFAFWVICQSRACERAKRCAGDAQACFDRMWPHVPERMKVAFRVTLKAVDAGGSLEEVKRKIREKLARFDAMAALKERGSNEHRSVPHEGLGVGVAVRRSSLDPPPQPSPSRGRERT